ncbi:MAG: hypothetical protein HN377_09910 [Alphaproteobacteria bacterium]|mgnify:CR=1 FL=1|jgi:uncharacterized protein|nr:hypothetical protein [Alphaproteobacteria bacterium]MBT7942104.1 hypothetical protein [Alphaproteobacteria bacterium]
MDSDPFRYDSWIEEALRSVIRRSLTYASENGLPGEHHFFLTFRTDAAGVEIPGYLKSEHGEEMTIILQHQFEELIVNEDAVWVTLRFNGTPERLRIPFDAMVSFADPSVNFGLQMKMPNELEDDEAQDPPAAMNADSDMDAPPAAKRPKGTGEVIALDSFRKK